MEVEKHTRGVGALVTNLLALETTLRYFITRSRGETPDFPHPGDKKVLASTLTNYLSLGTLINQYNSNLSAEEAAKFTVDKSVVDTRDAFAHGRLVTEDELPATLWKFGLKDLKDEIPVVFCEVLTEDYLARTSKHVDDQRDKVLACFKARNYRGLR